MAGYGAGGETATEGGTIALLNLLREFVRSRDLSKLKILKFNPSRRTNYLKPESEPKPIAFSGGLTRLSLTLKRHSECRASHGPMHLDPYPHPSL